MMDNHAIQIRRAESSDSAGVLTCLGAAFEPYRQQYTPAAFADTVLNPTTLAVRMRDMHVLVAVADGAVVGTFAWSACGTEGHLRGMAVLPEWQGKRIAEELLRHAERELRLRGCERLTLDTTEPLQRAIRFYLRNGYSCTGSVRDFFGMQLYEYSKAL